MTEIAQLHWLLGIIQNIGVGLVVIDRDYRIRLWNGFMEHHSGVGASKAIGEDLFVRFPQLPASWLRRKVDSVFLLNNRSFSTWQQRPYLLRFNSGRPITGGAEFMYQNLSLFPLLSVTGEVDHVCIMIYDATDVALDELALQQANAELERIGRTDGLTGLLNRRAWEESLEVEFRRTTRSRNLSTLVMFDIDHFKRINDTYGHLAGDQVLRRLSALLQKTQRTTDIAGRYGGEEFGVVLVDTDLVGAENFAERLRQRVEAEVFETEAGEVRCTISLGLAESELHFDDHKQWIERADKMLYTSKNEGRNRYTVYIA